MENRATVRALAALAAVSLLAACSNPGSGPVPLAAQNPAAVRSSSVPIVGGCQIFPSPPPSGATGNDWFNQDVSKLPIDPKSATYLKSMHASSENLHPDFGKNPTYGIPFVVVPSTQKKVPVAFHYSSQSDKGPYPVPPNAPIEGGAKSNGDRHVLVVQQGACTLYEMWEAHPQNGGKSWFAGSGAIFDLSSNKLRPNGWTSADAAGLPVFPALIRCDEVAAGEIDHAMRVTFNETQAGYIHPATHYAGSHDASLPPMGLRLRLKASYDVSHFNRTAKIILTAMKKYGLLVADNGSDWYFQGEGTGNNPKSCWNDNELDALKNVPGSAFEVVKTGQILRVSGP